MSSLVASAWLDKDLKYTLRFVSKSVFGFLATIALVVRTVEWTNYKEGERLEDCQNDICPCQNICIPGVTGYTGPNPKYPKFDKDDVERCDKQELSLKKKFAGYSSSICLTISTYISLIS